MIRIRYFKNIVPLLLVISIGLHGQESFQALDNTIPPSPTAGSLVKAVQTPVSYYTGIPSVVVPIWEMKGRKLNIPISLSYHASGIKVEELAGWVGLGWSLNAGGVVTRSVRGVPDDHTLGFLTTNGNQIPKILNDPVEFGSWDPPGEDEVEQMRYLENIGRSIRDGEPDHFQFNFNGRSGIFFFDVDGKIVMQSVENLEITFQKDVNGKIDSWEIVDEGGTVYTFGTTQATEYSAPVSATGINGEFHSSAWYLISITSANNEDLYWFEYQDYSKTVRSSLPQRKISGNDPKWEDMFAYQSHYIQGKYLLRITYPRGTIDFNVNSLYAYPGGEITGLKSISIFSRISENPIKSFEFMYSFFPGFGCATQQDYLPPCRRLRLDKVIEVPGFGEKTKPPHMFFYNEIPMPPRGSFSRDHWGYFNGADNDHLVPMVTVRNYHDYLELPPAVNHSGAISFEDLVAINLNMSDLDENIWELDGANREPDPAYMQAGILNKIVYPTGGSTLFEYEPHEAGYYSSPGKKKRVTIEAKYESGSFQREESSNFRLNFAQEVKITPLFYIIAGSEKDLPNGSGEPSDNSMVYIHGPIKIDSDGDTVFVFDYRMNMEQASGWEVAKKVWLPAGNYKVGTIADELGDISRAIVEYKQQSAFDTTYKIYSQEYSNERSRAGEMYFPDDKSEYRSVTFDIDSLDYPLVSFSFLFRSKVHPNRISSVGLEHPYSQIRITRIGGSGEILYEKGYFDDDLIKWNPIRNEWNYSGEESKILDPGRYQVEFTPRIESEFGFVEVKWKKSVEVRNSKMVGGLRIKQLTTVDRISDTTGITRFKYNFTDNGESRSSGVLMSWPVYYDTPEEIYYLNNQNFVNYNAPPLTIYSFGKSATSVTAGTHIGYSRVEVSRPGAGKSVYDFSSAINYPDITSKDFPYPPAVSYDWKRGLLKEKKIYREDGTIRQYEKSFYNDINDTLNKTYLPALKVVQKDPTSQYAYLYEKFYIPTGWNVLNRKEIVSFGLDGQNPVQMSETYEFDPSHLQLVNKKIWDSDSSILVTKYSYPGDPEVESGPEVDMLFDKHIINTPLIIESFRDSFRIDGEKTKYAIFNDDMVLPATLEKLEGTKYRPILHFDSYDSKANILQYHEEDGVFNSINWDVDKLFPVAKAINSEYKASLLDYSGDAYVTKYTYHPFWGVSSETNVNAIRSYYEYDNYGRLTQIRNDEHKILKTYEYHLKTYQGDTTRQGLEIIEILPSTSPVAILAGSISIVPSCGTELQVSGGSLGTGAEWVWYKDFCGGTKIGAGSSIYVIPDKTTTYFVRAEGESNNTACVNTTIEVSSPSLQPDHDILNFNAMGTGQSPIEVSLSYNGCDPLLINADVNWLNLDHTPGESLKVTCDPNSEGGERNGTIHIIGNGIKDSISVFQLGSDPLEITLNYSPTFIQMGDLINFTASAQNGSFPYHYVWEKRDSDILSWSIIRDINDSYSNVDSFSIKAGTEEFYVRCTVFSHDKSGSQTVLIKVAN